MNNFLVLRPHSLKIFVLLFLTLLWSGENIAQAAGDLIFSVDTVSSTSDPTGANSIDKEATYCHGDGANIVTVGGSPAIIRLTILSQNNLSADHILDITGDDPHIASDGADIMTVRLEAFADLDTNCVPDGPAILFDSRIALNDIDGTGADGPYTGINIENESVKFTCSNSTGLETLAVTLDTRLKVVYGDTEYPSGTTIPGSLSRDVTFAGTGNFNGEPHSAVIGQWADVDHLDITRSGNDGFLLRFDGDSDIATPINAVPLPCGDLGDIPDTYGTDYLPGNSGSDLAGPSHFDSPGMYLGASLGDVEINPAASVSANGDDIANGDDEDGIASFPALNPGTTTYSLTIPVTNDPTVGVDPDATLIGWIDFDRDGIFQADEAATALVPEGGTSANLTWNNIGSSGPDIIDGLTFARFRISSDAFPADDNGTSVDERVSGRLADGEVEDYALTIDAGLPVTTDDTGATSADTNVSIAVTSNDSDPDGTLDCATIDVNQSLAGVQTTFTQPGEGTYTVSGCNVVFNPLPTFFGTTTPLAYTIDDNDGNTSNSSTITIEVDSDNDGISVAVDLDDDNDGIPDTFESANANNGGDTDGDGVLDQFDLDSDNDGRTDVLEASANGATFDTNNDGRIDNTYPVGANGLANAVETALDSGTLNYVVLDSDGDGAEDYVDIDSDDDGLTDVIENGNTDANNDGIVDGTPNSGTGLVPGVVSNAPDTDNDTDPDYLDIDSDGDGISDNVEGQPSPPGYVTPSGNDNDGDGLDDSYDSDDGGLPIVPVNTDGSGPADYKDSDSDNDGIPDATELTGDPDGDLAPNYRDLDSDGDNIPDVLEGTPDTDGDTVPDYLDTDSDDDGTPDSDEGLGDSDGDGISDFLDPDTDNDGIPDDIEGDNDSDGDGNTDRLDRDSDNDGIPDVIEAGGVDANGDGLPDSFTDADHDGIIDLFDVSEGGAPLADPDFDSDGIVNRLDLDADGDGIVDLREGGGADTDGNGIVDGTFLDPDGDGFSGIYDRNDGGTPLPLPNSDGVAGRDYLDLDSDNDGISDNVEGQPSPPGHVPPAGNDDDGDGIDDAYDADDGGLPIVPVNTEGVGAPDYRDVDTDNDGILDSVEGTADPDGDLAPNYRDLDSDGDGLPDAVEGTVDSDGDTTPNYLDLDSDGDGIPDSGEGLPDSDGDGVADFHDLDSDNDGVLDSDELAVDSDGDGVPDNLDHDSDNDGIPDIIEAGGVDANGDGQADASTDTDADGWANTFDPSNGGTPLASGDLDNDGLDNRIDVDSDDDGLTDLYEAGGSDSDRNGRVDGIFDDLDGDGFFSAYDTSDGGSPLARPNTDATGGADYLDADSDGDNIPDNIEAQPHGPGFRAPLNNDNDGDGLDDQYDSNDGGTPIVVVNTDGVGSPDFRDLDSDNDTIVDSIELTGDPDGDGTPNYRDLDSDGDTILDSTEGSGDTDGDTTPDFLDTDSDNDTIPDSVEGTTNTDGDGRPDYRDIDADNDGVLDSAEGSTDTDDDGIGNWRDHDSDNDGLADLVEAGGTDANGDGSADSTTDTDSDGWVNTYDPTNGGTPLADGDADGDSLANRVDLDSDDDGITDLREANGTDANGDGLVDGAFEDADADGFSSLHDTNDGGTALTPPNTDSNGAVDYLDTDSDDDLIPDNVEAQPHGVDFVPPSGNDADSDGIDDAYDPSQSGTPLIDLVDTDESDAPDFRDPESDGDTISDLIEGTGDPDNDGDPNYRDLDSDGDTIPDEVEGAGDEDGDTTPDFLDTDSDADGIDDSIEGTTDTDGDGSPNYLDIDSDSDGVEDSLDLNVDSDRDGLPNYLDLDSDNDGITDLVESGGPDTDGNGIADSLTDTDGDGLADVFDSDNGGTPSPITNSDADALPDFLDIDSDADGIPDIRESQHTDTYVELSGDDTDSDGLDDTFDVDNGGVANVPENTDATDTADPYDTDSDNDGVPDSIEGHDANADGVADVSPASADADSDGLDDAYDTVSLTGSGQAATNAAGSNAPIQDRDSDGVRDWRDTDDDADAIPTSAEDVNTNNNWADDDGDGDNTPDYLDLDSDNDGILNVTECLGQAPCADTDGDGVTNHLDLDSDNDGVPDATESADDNDGDEVPNYLDIDADNDGIVDVLEAGGTDSDGDGRLDSSTDADDDGLLAPVDTDESGTALSIPNTDSDAVADYLDIDADADGIVDIVEAQTTSGYQSPSGDDTDGDGLDDAYDTDNGGTALVPVNTDGATVPDYLDSDSEDDSFVDAIEGHDANHNGVADVVPAGSDSDGDGLDDAFDTFDLTSPPLSGTNAEGSNSALPDLDADTIRDWRDADDDDDGIPSIDEGPVDTDGDGTPDAYDVDSDGDGALDEDEFGGDDDGDNIPNHLDPNCSLQFLVQLPSGEPLEEITLSDGGSLSGITDENGLLTIPDVGNGVYNFSATLPDGGLIGRPQVTVANGSCGGLITVTATQALQNPLYFVWNGFYRQQNVAGAVNKCPFPIGVEVSLIDLSGVTRSTVSVPLLAHAEYDVVANALAGFGTDTYGYIKVNYLQPECAEGYAAHYRQSLDQSHEEFSISKPFESIQKGVTYAEFNTLQPDVNADKLDDESPHWVQIVNLHPTSFKNFRVVIRDITGAVVDDSEVVVGPLARYDTQGGHERPGALRAGTVQVIPGDLEAPYLAQLHNYNADGPFAVFADTFSFAGGVTTRGGARYTQYVNISSGGAGMDWLVLSNIESSPTVVALEFWANDGTLLRAESRTLGARQQDHIYTSGILRGVESGIVKIKPQNRQRIFARNMVYFPGAGGRISAVYGVPSRAIFGGTLAGLYNSFFGTFNYVKLSNVTNSAATATVRVYDVSGTLLGERVVSLAAHTGTDLELKVNLGIAIPADSYGLVEVIPSVSGAIYSELLRIRPGDATQPIDMALSLPVR